MARSSTAAAADTLAAGGKRLRPLLVFMCGAGGWRSRSGRCARARGRRGRAGPHGDARPRRRRRRRDGAARPARRCSPPSGRAGRHGNRRLPLLACVRAAGGERRRRAGAGARRTPASRWRAVSSRSARTPSPPDVDVDRYLYRCGLKTASLFTAACRLGALATGAGSDARRRARSLRPRDRARVPGARRRARRHRAGGAHRQGARQRPARGNHDAAADPRRGHRSCGWPASTFDRSTSREQAESICDRIAATGRARRVAPGRDRPGRPMRRPSSTECSSPSRPSCWSWSPTASSTATRKPEPSELRKRNAES